MTDVTTLSMRIAEEIRVLMVRKRVNQKQLAQRLNVSAMWVSGRLTGQTEIAVNDLPRIASALGVPMLDLLPRSERSGTEAPTVRYDQPAERPGTRHPVDNRPGTRKPTGRPDPHRTSRVPRPSRP